MEQYIIVTSKGEDPSDFVSFFGDNIDTSNNSYEVALKEIYHAPIYNITSENSTFKLIQQGGSYSQIFKIPDGFYESNADILNAIDYEIENFSNHNPTARGSKTKISYKAAGEAISLDLIVSKMVFSVKDSPLLRYLGYSIPQNVARLDINITQFRNAITPTCIYSSCVGNSIFDDTQSRLLSIAPLSSKAGYNHYEFINPSYVPLAIQSLRDINFVAMDVDGKKIMFDYQDETKTVARFPLILKLHVRKIV